MPLLAVDAPVKRALLVAEKDGFQHVVGDRRAIYGDKGRIGALGMIVDKFGKHFLAGAGRAVHKHRDIRLGDAPCQRQQITAGLVAAGNRALVGQECSASCRP